ncbi:MAG: UvrD-helicase domain-containing protein, partial [Oscillospiraceae bacterium]|nr:UvrD-helicase domain-containing protein [Oscillospiraceae bacterium]
IRLLTGENNESSVLALEVANRYREIMVDEYQDTNEVQNCIFNAISREGKNLFTVGDVKQSIYRFRLADPSIFLDHYEKFPAAAEAEEGQSGKLLLSKNFRSRSEVLEATNFVFRGILSREMGELDYGEDEALHYGDGYEPGIADDAEFHLLNIPSQRKASEKVKAAVAEADFVAKRIRQLLDEGFLIQDGKTRRKVREEDIVILMRNPGKRYDTYRRALERCGIRATGANEGGEFYETIEIAVLYALLQVIDNPRQDVPLITVLRSPLFSFTPDDLARVRGKTRGGDFYDALKADESEKSRAFFDLLTQLRELAPTLSAFELTAHIYDRCGVYAVFGAMEDGAIKQENLEGFLEIARGFGGGLFDFLCHLKSLLEIEKAPQPQRSKNAQGVRIMSIHRSKGLEFPVVILCDLAAQFNTQDYIASVLVHPKLGLGPACVDTARSIRYASQAQRAVESELRRESKAEEMRVLYVAMTRAKEKLIMVYAKESVQKHVADLVSATSYPVLPQVVEGANCLGDFILLPLLT